MPDLEEIIVRARRPRSTPVDVELPEFRELDFASESDRDEIAREAQEEEEEEEETIEEVVVTAAPITLAGTTDTLRRFGQTDLERTLGVARARSLQAVVDAANIRELEEITVKAKRLAPTAGRMAMRGPLAFLSFFDIGAQIVDELSRQRLDEVGRLATRTVEPGPDTPVKTIPEPAPLPEIKVIGRRPPAPLPAFPLFLRDIPSTTLPLAVGFPDPTVTAVPEISVPRPEMPKRPKPKLFSLFDTARPGQHFLTNPLGLPRSTLFNIPRRTPGATIQPGNLTGFDPMVISSPQLAGGSCPPCRKPKPKKRKKCWKTLVKQRTNPARDKVHKLVEINCATGREIYKRKK